MSAILDGYVEGALRGRNRQLGQTTQMLDEAQANTELLIQAVDARDAHIVKLNAEIARLKDALALETADAAGRESQFDAFKAQHADSPLLADSGRRFKVSGKAKTKARLIYEAAFDKKAREMGIANPAERRVD